VKRGKRYERSRCRAARKRCAMPREKIAEKTSTSIPLLERLPSLLRFASCCCHKREYTCVACVLTHTCCSRRTSGPPLESEIRFRSSQMSRVEDFPLVRVVVDVVVDILSISRAYVCHITIGQEEIESLELKLSKRTWNLEIRFQDRAKEHFLFHLSGISSLDRSYCRIALAGLS